MERITVGMIQEAYNNTGLKPLQGLWYYKNCGCALTALYCNKKGLKEVDDYFIDAAESEIESIISVINHEFPQYNLYYFLGLINGYDFNPSNPARLYGDNNTKIEEIVEFYNMGYNDGELARKAIDPKQSFYYRES